jgi:hypothetical protein
MTRRTVLAAIASAAAAAVLGIRPKPAGAATCGKPIEPHCPCGWDTHCPCGWDYQAPPTYTLTMNGVTHTLIGRLSHDGKTWTFSGSATPGGTCTISAM